MIYLLSSAICFFPGSLIRFTQRAHPINKYSINLNHSILNVEKLFTIIRRDEIIL